MPSRLKLDTSSNHDIVSYKFLVTSLELRESAFEYTPEEQQEEIVKFKGQRANPGLGNELCW